MLLETDMVMLTPHFGYSLGLKGFDGEIFIVAKLHIKTGVDGELLPELILTEEELLGEDLSPTWGYKSHNGFRCRNWYQEVSSGNLEIEFNIARETIKYKIDSYLKLFKSHAVESHIKGLITEFTLAAEKFGMKVI